MKDLKAVNKILKRVREKESKIEFSRVGDREDVCVLGVSDASYSQTEDKSIAGEIIMLGNEKTTKAVPLFWRSGVIRNVCMSPKAAETRAMVKLADDATYIRRQLEILLGSKVRARLYTDSRPLLETIGSSGQIEEKNLRQSVMFLKQSLERGDILGYSWIQGEEIVADVLTKQRSRREALQDIVMENKFRHVQTRDNWVYYENGEIKIQNLVMKRQRQEI